MPTSTELLTELKAECERLAAKDLDRALHIVRMISTTRQQLDDLQKDHDEYTEEMSLGGQTYRERR